MSCLAIAAALVAIPLAASAEAPRAEGRIESGGARVEILGRPARVGETIQLPEGYIRVEEAGPEDDEIGSFSVVPAATFSPPPSAPAGDPARPQVLAAAAPPAAETEAVPEVAPVPPPGPARCRNERAAYLAEIWKHSGIELDDPAAFLDGFEGASGNQNVANLWFALSTDAFRPLAWSSDARAKAAALARCMRAR